MKRMVKGLNSSLESINSSQKENPQFHIGQEINHFTDIYSASIQSKYFERDENCANPEVSDFQNQAEFEPRILNNPLDTHQRLQYDY